MKIVINNLDKLNYITIGADDADDAIIQEISYLYNDAVAEKVSDIVDKVRFGIYREILFDNSK